MKMKQLKVFKLFDSYYNLDKEDESKLYDESMFEHNLSVYIDDTLKDIELQSNDKLIVGKKIGIHVNLSQQPVLNPNVLFTFNIKSGYAIVSDKFIEELMDYMTSRNRSSGVDWIQIVNVLKDKIEQRFDIKISNIG